LFLTILDTHFKANKDVCSFTVSALDAMTSTGSQCYQINHNKYPRAEGGISHIMS